MKTISALLFHFLLLVAPVAWSTEDIPPPPPEPKGAKKPRTQSDYFLIRCKIYINEDGTAKTVEVLSVNPPLGLNRKDNKEFVESILKSVRTWTFNPNKENGKPVAGYAIVPVDVHLADPIKIGGSN